jgi:predicted RND superfamily exporter protein
MLALGATIILIILAFPYLWQRVLTLVSLLLGILWMAATMLAFGMKLNFLNFVAFPITCGNGVDYGVNVMRRMSDETSAASEDRHAVVDRALRQTGAAVALCSLTTVIGYVSLQASSNLAIRSFGQAMAISEVTCLAAATLVLTAMFLRRGRP